MRNAGSRKRKALRRKLANPWDTLPADAAAREKALLAIIAADPRPVAPKLLLIHAAIDARHSSLAVAVTRQLLPDFFRDDGEVTEWVAKSFLPTLDAAERASHRTRSGRRAAAAGRPARGFSLCRVSRNISRRPTPLSRT